MKKYLQNRKTDIVICNNCGHETIKPLSEIKRNTKLCRKLFCSPQCAIEYGRKQPKTVTDKMQNHLKDMNTKRWENNVYKDFNYTFRNCKRRYQEFNISIDDLIEQWNIQDGICPYTGLKLILPRYSTTKTIPIEIRASLDRIDSTKGYVIHNIQFVSTPINYLKNTMSDLQTKQYLKLIFDNSDFSKD